MWAATKNNKVVSTCRAVYLTLALALFVLSYLHKLDFVAGYSLCAIIFEIIQVSLVSLSHKHEAYQQGKCKSIGFMLLIPALGMIANGIGLLFIAVLELSHILLLALMGMSTAMFMVLTAPIFFFRKDSSLAAKFLRYTDCAALSPPIYLIVLMALMLNSDESAAEIGCL